MSNSTLNHSGQRTPCPICERTHDRDCSWTDDLGMVLCHTYVTDPPSTINGYQFRKLADSGLHGADSAAMYVKNNEQKAIRKASRTEYTYTLPDDSPLVKVVRIDDGKGSKKIFQQHYLGGEWFDGVPTSTRPKIPLYRIYDKRNQYAISMMNPLLVVEGEGKVDLLLSMGIPATCSIGGAGKWGKYGHETYIHDLKGANVVIVPDRDKPGMEHALTIAQDFPSAHWLYPFPDSPLWDNLPAKNGLDIADWVNDYRLSVDEIYAAIGPKREVATAQDRNPGAKTEPIDETSPQLLREYERIKRHWGDRIRFNELLKQVELDGQCIDPTTAKLELAINYRVSLKSGREDIADCVVRLAMGKSYHPVEEYLNQVADRHGASITPLSCLASYYLGTDNELHNLLLIKFLVGAVARVMQPGCKNDCALILQGRQGIGKSSFFRALAGDAWFDDSLGSVSDKDERLKLHRTWFVEWAELESVFKRRDISQVKAFMSCATDLVRPPYGRVVETMHRRCVIVGSTNEDEFLADATGNRRFWVIPVTHSIDLDELQRNRDRIWAAAVNLYRAGKQWWLTPEEENDAERDREAYRYRDAWYPAIEHYCETHNPVSTGEILSEVLKLEVKDHDQARKRRVTSVLKTIGWKASEHPVTHFGVRCRVWIKPQP